MSDRNKKPSLNKDPVNVKRGTGKGRERRQTKKSTLEILAIKIRMGISRFRKSNLKGKKTSSLRIGRSSAIGAIIAISALILFALIYLNTNKNAISISISGTEVAIIKNSKKIDPEEIKEQALDIIRNEMGTNILINEKIEFIPVHSSKKDIVEPSVASKKISGSVTYKIEAFKIRVNGADIAYLKTESEAQGILDKLMEPYLKEDLKIVEKGFVEEVEIISEYIEKEDITSAETALNLLSSKSESPEVYIIKEGDFLSTIATNSGMSLEELLNMNPDYTIDTKIKIGSELLIKAEKPMLTVKTVIESVYEEVEPKPVKTLNNPEQHISYRQSIEYGSDGVAKVTKHTTRINGIESEVKEVNREIIVEPTPEVIEVGTSNTAPSRALGSFIYPVTGQLSDPYDARGGAHKGIDWRAPAGTPVRASDGGIVTKAEWYSGYGYFVSIEHGNGFISHYGHNSSLEVEEGQMVRQGEIIARIGSTGNSTGNHLHFELFKDGEDVNPLEYLGR